ncbi:MAG: type II toxin-antitoxin system VapB family antitoxin [Cytophagaceae bacterium]|nr:type II toxin-antitoxin system VapB family antitoxin [Cytophagaceae bacterium]MBK9511465.1 type II toxin-antitoxin system VapB family antitoxin [Cytophagaceae bacterium]MBK9932587.1 type II toxin-antitoxin system VapB family antitoxin [Cytophagaceae bacterium]MBL0303729.1 type II toxin-antitoxin system VapB family antitoxin [Cytophagaceae bacterium]MBL0326552.1 type II toxin-antitoxin system VapB family antitoxin [Cytophagaceae bacterium]
MRTNIVLDSQLIDRAMNLSGHKTMRALINEALKEYIKRQEIKQLTEFKGSNVWEGDLNEMRSSNYAETY